MLEKQKVMAFIATRDGARARRFYETVLGLTVVSDDDFALAIEANGTLVRVQKVEELIPQSFTALGWQVVDIASAVKELEQRGVACERFPGMKQDALGIWHSPNGADVAWFKDPDGNTLSLTQF